MDLWKNKVVPKFKILLGGKKAAAAIEACKSFDESKVEVSKEFEEKKDELKPKTIKIYEESSTEIKALIKEPTVAGLKKNSTKVNKFLEELVTIDFPGSKAVHDATKLYGTTLVSGPITFVFEKVSTFVVTEEKDVITTTSREVEVTPPTAETTEVVTTTTVETVEAKETLVEKPVVAEPEKVVVAPAEAKAKETLVEKPVVAEPEKVVVASTEAPTKAEPAKLEETPKAK